MGREKQINEIVKIIARRRMDFRNPNVAFMTTARKTADSIYNADYRKQSEPISCSHGKGGEWISVDERLPEQCVPVLVYKNRNSEAYGNMETAYFEKGRWRGSCGEFITYWMPLPEAPKMKGGKQE